MKVLEGNTDRETLRSISRRVFLPDGYAQRTVSFENMSRENLIPTTRTILQRSVFDCRNSKDNVDTTMHFCLKEVTPTSTNLERYGPWGPERVILLGAVSQLFSRCSPRESLILCRVFAQARVSEEKPKRSWVERGEAGAELILKVLRSSKTKNAPYHTGRSQEESQEIRSLCWGNLFSLYLCGKEG